MAKPILESICSSPFFALCVDVTTDISVTTQLIVYGRYLVEGDVHTSFEGPPLNEFPYEKACDVWGSWRNRRIDVTV